MKLYSTLLLVLMACLVMQLPAQNRWIEDPQMKFKISVPNNYQTNEFWDGTDKIHAFVSRDQNVAVRVRTIPVQANITTEMIVQVFSQNIIKGAQQIVNQSYTLNGMNGVMAAYKWKYNKINVVIGAFYTIQNNFAYVVWTMVPENLLAKRNAESDAITNSFVVLNGNSQTSAPAQSGGLGSLGGLGNNQVAMEQPANITITDMAIGDEMSFDLFIDHPVSTVVPSTKKIYFVFGYNGNAKGNTFITKCYNETTNSSLGEFPFFPSDAPSGRGQATIDCPGNEWTAADYRVEIWLNDKKLDEKSFKVLDTETGNLGNAMNSQIIPAGYFVLVSDDACLEHFVPTGYQVTDSDLGQKIWSNGSGLNMIQQLIIKQTDFETFMDDHLNDLKNKGAEVVASAYLDVEGLHVCQYIYTYGNSVFSYLSSENNNLFYLLGFAGNISNEERAIEYSNTIINSFKKANCPF